MVSLNLLGDGVYRNKLLAECRSLNLTRQRRIKELRSKTISRTSYGLAIYEKTKKERKIYILSS